MLISSWLTSLGYRVRGLSRRSVRRPGLERRRASLSATSLTTSVFPRQTESLEQRLVLSSTEWVAMGPTAVLNGQTENVQIAGADLSLAANGAAENPVIGAVNVVLPHPNDPKVLFVGAVNGGVWRTTNATEVNYTWQPLTDFAPSLSIGAMAFDAADPTGNRLIVAVGRTSSFSREGGELTGLLLSTNAMAENPTFTPIGQSDLADVNIDGVTFNGDRIVVASNKYAGMATPGIRVSTNGGASFNLVSGSMGSMLPAGPAFDLVSDPSMPDRLYAGIGRFDQVSDGGVFRSDDGGDHWTNVSGDKLLSKIIPPITGQQEGTNNIELAIHANMAGNTNAVYAAIVTDGQISGIFRSSEGVDGIDQNNDGMVDDPSETNFVEMDVPRSIENAVAVFSAVPTPDGVRIKLISGGFLVNHGLRTGNQVLVSGVPGANGTFVIKVIDDVTFELKNAVLSGPYTGGGTVRALTTLQPKAKPGGQGATHLSIVADPTDPFIVYVGGDRQDAPSGADAGVPFKTPSSIGATNYTGRLFKGDARIPTQVSDTVDFPVTVLAPGAQWSPLTHVGTISNSAPHADSRELAFDASGVLIEADDGGLYRRTGAYGGVIETVTSASPVIIKSTSHGLKGGETVRITGVSGITGQTGSQYTVVRIDADHFSLTGTTGAGAYAGGGVWGAGDWIWQGSGLQVTEIHNVAYDSLSNSIIAGAQDVGTPQQDGRSADSLIWNDLSQADGGDVAVDVISLQAMNQSIRYSSFQNLAGFQRTIYDSSGKPVGAPTPVPLTLTSIPDGPSRTVTAVSKTPEMVGDNVQQLLTMTVPGHGLLTGEIVTLTGVANGDTFRLAVLRIDANTIKLANTDSKPLSNYASVSSLKRTTTTFRPQFLTPVALNANDPSRMVFVAIQVAESFNQGTTLVDVGPGTDPRLTASQNAVAYGDKPGGTNPDVLYVGVGSSLNKRTSGTGRMVLDTAFEALGNTSPIADVVLNPDRAFSVFVVTSAGAVYSGHNLNYSTTNGTDDDGDGMVDEGDEVPAWSAITDNLAGGKGRSMAFIPGNGYDVLAVGTDSGVYARRINDLTDAAEGSWIEIGASTLPNAPVFDLAYDSVDQVLVAGTLGRGAWIIGAAPVFGVDGEGTADELFDVKGRTGDLLTVDLTDYQPGNEYTITGVSIPAAGETVSLSVSSLGYELDVDGEILGTLVLPENLGEPAFETGGTFHFLPALADGLSVDSDPAAQGFQGRLEFDVLANGISFTITVNVQPGHSVFDEPFTVVAGSSLESNLRLEQRLAFLGMRDADGSLPIVDGNVDEHSTAALRLFQSQTDPLGRAVPIAPSEAGLGGTSATLATGVLDSDTLRWLNHPNAPHWVQIVDPDPQAIGTFSLTDVSGAFDILPDFDPGTAQLTGNTPSSESYGSSWVVQAVSAAAEQSATANPALGGIIVAGISTVNGYDSAIVRNPASPGLHHATGMEVDIYVSPDARTGGNGTIDTVGEQRLAAFVAALKAEIATTSNIQIASVTLANPDLIQHLNSTVFAGESIAMSNPSFNQPQLMQIQFVAPTLPPIINSQLLGALAYVDTTDILFQIGEALVGSSLLGHELTHVVQQKEGSVSPGGGSGTPSQQSSGGVPGSPVGSGNSGVANLVQPVAAAAFSEGHVGTESQTPLSDLSDEENPTFGNILGLAQRLRDDVTKPISTYLASDATPTLPELIASLDSPGSPLSNFVTITDTSETIEFAFDMDFGRHITRPLDFGAMLAAIGLEIDSTGLLDLEVSFSTNITLGFDISGGKSAAEAVFLKFDPIVVTASAEIPEDPGLDISARLGFFGVSIHDGSLALDASITAHLNDDNPFSLSEFFASVGPDFITFDDPIGTIDAVLPITLEIGSFNSDVEFGEGSRPVAALHVDNFFDGVDADDFSLQLPSALNLFTVDAGGINGLLDQVRDVIAVNAGLAGAGGSDSVY